MLDIYTMARAAMAAAQVHPWALRVPGGVTRAVWRLVRARRAAAPRHPLVDGPDETAAANIGHGASIVRSRSRGGRRAWSWAP